MTESAKCQAENTDNTWEDANLALVGILKKKSVREWRRRNIRSFPGLREGSTRAACAAEGRVLMPCVTSLLTAPGTPAPGLSPSLAWPPPCWPPG